MGFHEHNARVKEYAMRATRFRMVEKLDPERFARLPAAAQRNTAQRFAVYEQLANLTVPTNGNQEEKSG